MRAVAAAMMLAILICPMGAPPAHPQDLVTPQPNILPPPPPALPPPKIEVPKIPKMDEIPPSPRAALPRRGSFSDRMSRCIEEAAAAGLGPNERAAYSRTCANSR